MKSCGFIFQFKFYIRGIEDKSAGYHFSAVSLLNFLDSTTQFENSENISNEF